MGGGGEMVARRARWNKKITMKNFVEKDKLQALAMKSERRTVKELKQRRVGGRPLLGTEFKTEVLEFFQRSNLGQRRRVPDGGTIF